jgi:hypothetical protein
MVVTHSHPVNHENGDSSPNHKHSKSEICFYSSFNIDYYDVTPEFQIEKFECLVVNNYGFQSFGIPNSANYFHKKLRGPPTFQIF